MRSERRWPLLLAATVLGSALIITLWPAPSLAPAKEGPATLPARLANYSYLTGDVAASPPGRAVALFQHRFGGRQLPPLPAAGAWLVVVEVDDEVVQLESPGDPESEDLPGGFVLPLTTADGTRPQWAQSPAAEGTYHHRVGNVILRSENRYVDSTTAVLDLKGRELWDVGNNQLGIAGTHLFVSWPSSSDPATGYSNLHEVNPRTGKALNGYDYMGWFDRTVAVQDHIAVLRGGTLHILDDRMMEQPEIAVEGINSVYEGDKRAYVHSYIEEPDASVVRLSAVDPDQDDILWTLEFEEDQHVWQLGRHLVVVDCYGSGLGNTIHGLRSD